VSATGFAVANKVYDGTTAATITSLGTLSWAAPGDDVTLDTSGASASFTNPNVGNGRVAIGTGYTLTGADAGNYVLTQPSTIANITSSDGTTIYSDIYHWNGVATVKVTVTQSTPNSPYLWDYNVTNESFADGIANFAVPVGNGSLISNLGSSLGWSGSVGAMSDPDLVAWQAGVNPLLGIGNSADFTFATVPVDVAQTNGLVAGIVGLNLTNSPAGFLAVPLAALFGLPQAPQPALLVETNVDKYTPNVGLTSLREAIEYVNQNGDPLIQQRIAFAEKLASQRFFLNDQLTISKNIFVDGNETISRDVTKGSFRLFHVKAGATLQLADLSLEDGYVDQQAGFIPGFGGGGAIWSEGTLFATSCLFTGNGVSPDGYEEGGAIWASGQKGPGGIVIGLLVITDCEFINNWAANGGAVAADGPMQNITISGSEFSENRARNSGGALYFVGQSNTAYPDTTAVITNCTIDTNFAVNGNGGGIYTRNVSLILQKGTGVNQLTVISNNQATNGGGVYVVGSVINGVPHGLISYAGVSIGNNKASEFGSGVYRDSAARTGTDDVDVLWFGNPVNTEVHVNDP
jgi:hypothetical protein